MIADVESPESQRARIADLEARLAESEETLSAIRRGDFDAVVVETLDGERQIYTLENADRPYRALIEQIQEGALTLSTEGAVLYCNRRLAEMVDARQERLIGQDLAPFIAEPDRDRFAALLVEAMQGAARDELMLSTAEGRCVPVAISLSPFQRDDGTPLICGILTDLTGQRQHLRDLSEVNAQLRAEGLERQRVEDALRQAQKMEAVGQLTGGLAHDFNNLLAGISGNLELLQVRIDRGRIHDVGRYITAAQGAASRAAALTHRLLAFSRRQTLDPKPTNVSRLIGGMEDLIRRTVGPAIAFDIVAAAGAWTVLVDPPQLENALLNLCINARDAMPDGGRITIETKNEEYDADAAREHDMAPGAYLSLCVSDTGTGMPPDVVAKAFDPFFTTKPIGEGTGLGLSMIYGFARQSGGQVKIQSEVGQGTRVCVHLPRQHGDEAEASAPAPMDGAPRAQQGETVLVVDDEPTVRMLILEVLEELGYAAIEAGDSLSGLKILQSKVRIDLLVTDVGLPGGMNGRQMAEAGLVHRPGLKILFITGYAENAVLSSGHLRPGMKVLTKPFVLETLATRIRELIG